MRLEYKIYFILLFRPHSFQLTYYDRKFLIKKLQNLYRVGMTGTTK